MVGDIRLINSFMTIGKINGLLDPWVSRFTHKLINRRKRTHNHARTEALMHKRNVALGQTHRKTYLVDVPAPLRLSLIGVDCARCLMLNGPIEIEANKAIASHLNGLICFSDFVKAKAQANAQVSPRFHTAP